jgi:hypothetical protein
MFQQCHTDAPAMPNQITEIRRDAAAPQLDCYCRSSSKEA